MLMIFTHTKGALMDGLFKHIDNYRDHLIKVALEAAHQGKVTTELKELYDVLHRDYVPWQDFPICFQPSSNEDGVGHEG